MEVSNIRAVILNILLMFDVMSEPNCTRIAINYPAIIRDPKQGKIVQETVCAVKSDMEPVKRERRYSIQKVATHFFPKRLDRNEVRGFILFGMLTFSAHADLTWLLTSSGRIHCHSRK